MASTNFLQFNPGAVNQETDSQYTADSSRSGGAVTGIFASALLNKVFYQSSTFIAALANTLANKGYSTSDASLATLESVLSNIVTFADLKANLSTVAFSTTPNFNATATNGFDFTLAANVTSSTLTGHQVGQTLTFVVAQGATPYSFSPPPNINGWIPVPVTANTVFVQTFIVRADGTVWPTESEIGLLVSEVAALQLQLATSTVGDILVSNGTSYSGRTRIVAVVPKYFGVTYQNNTPGSILVTIIAGAGSPGGQMQANVGPLSPSIIAGYQSRVPAADSDPYQQMSMTFEVPQGWFYSATSGGGMGLNDWVETYYQ
jgi:hypothetical protein